MNKATIAAASSSSEWIPTWAYADQGLNDTYTGNFLNGYGGAIGLTSTAQGLQFVDAGFPMSVLCKSFVGFQPADMPPSFPPRPPAAPLPTSNEAPPAAITPRIAGSQYTYIPITSTLYMTPEACQSVEKYPKPFNYQYSDATAYAWNTTQTQNNGTAFIQVGDVVVTSNTASCSSSGRKLASSSSASR